MKMYTSSRGIKITVKKYREGTPIMPKGWGWSAPHVVSGGFKSEEAALNDAVKTFGKLAQGGSNEK